MFNWPIADEFHYSVLAQISTFLGWVAYIFLSIKISLTVLPSLIVSFEPEYPDPQKMFETRLKASLLRTTLAL